MGKRTGKPKTGKPRLKPTKGWAAPDRNGKVDLFSVAYLEFNRAVSVPIVVRDARDDKEIQAKNRKLTTENNRLARDIKHLGSELNQLSMLYGELRSDLGLDIGCV